MQIELGANEMKEIKGVDKLSIRIIIVKSENL